jgi:hypothetical protein
MSGGALPVQPHVPAAPVRTGTLAKAAIVAVLGLGLLLLAGSTPKHQGPKHQGD